MIMFAFHGYPWLIHRLTYRRHGRGNLHVRGYKEEARPRRHSIMAVRNDLDRFHLARSRHRSGALARRTSRSPASATARPSSLSIASTCRKHGEDMPEVRDWQ